MDKVDDFLKRHMLKADMIDEDEVLSLFLSEMEKGLKGEKSSLQMIPTYCTLDSDIKAGDKVIVLDAGGTNFRTCLVTFNENLEPQISDFRKVGMPGVKSEVSAKAFFSTLADNVERLIDKSDKIGFCFSYAAAITEDHDGIPIMFSKEIKAPEVIGMPIGKSLLAELSSRGHDVSKKKVSVVNDTVATLLATKAKCLDACSGYIGFILGTGTNTAYAELNSNISKINMADKNERQIINVESGDMRITLGDIDQKFIAGTKDPESYFFEKAISGAYLGPFSHMVISQAIAEGVLSSSFAKKFETLPTLSTTYMSNYLEMPHNTDYVLVSMLDSEEDATALYKIIDSIIERAAKLTAINLSAAVIKSDLGNVPRLPVIINADGTTFYKTENLEFYTRKYLFDILQKKHGRYVKIVNVPDSPVYGAAIAGCSI